MLWLYQRTMFGQLDNPANQNLTDMNWRELATLVPLIIMAFWIGIYPAPFFRAVDKPMTKIVQKVRPDYFQTTRQAQFRQTLPANAKSVVVLDERAGSQPPLQLSQGDRR
jgi:NADH-quinone oxidoreductase subunit M